MNVYERRRLLAGLLKVELLRSSFELNEYNPDFEFLSNIAEIVKRSESKNLTFDVNVLGLLTKGAIYYREGIVEIPLVEDGLLSSFKGDFLKQSVGEIVHNDISINALGSAASVVNASGVCVLKTIDTYGKLDVQVSCSTETNESGGLTYDIKSDFYTVTDGTYVIGGNNAS